MSHPIRVTPINLLLKKAANKAQVAMCEAYLAKQREKVKIAA
jgi:hypothetical protein